MIIPEFVSFDSIPRLSRECIITEKLDGTNACIFIDEENNLIAGSRSQWLLDGKDNFGFATWTAKHKDQLIVELGIGRHFGEWWGAGIQRTYGLKEKRFSLFNTKRWAGASLDLVSVVPVLYDGPFNTDSINEVLHLLEKSGSIAAPGFMHPEGIVIYHKAGHCVFKKTIEHDIAGKDHRA